MNLTYKIALPAFLASILVIVWFTLSSEHSLVHVFAREEFLRVTETVRRKVPRYLKKKTFQDPFSASSQKQFKDFAEEIQASSIAQLNIWNRERAVVFSGLKSAIGLRSPGHEELRRLFAGEKPFFIVKDKDVNEPIRAGIGQFVDIYIPIRLGGEVVGAVEVHSVIAGILTPVEQHISEMVYILIPASLLILAAVLAVVYYDRRLQKQAEGQIQNSLRQITALHEIGKAVASTLDLGEVLRILLEKIDHFLPYSAASVRLLNRESGKLEPVASRNFDVEEWKARVQQVPRSLTRWAWEHQAPVVVENFETDERVQDPGFFREHGFVSLLVLPLIDRGEPIGSLSLWTKREHRFSDEEVGVFSALAGQAAIAIRNSQLYEETKRQAAELARSNSVKDEFLGVISHELRTPLNVVVGYVELVKSRVLGEINAEQEQALEKVIGQANEQLHMVNTILEATKIEVGEARAVSEDLNLAELLDRLRSHYGASPDKEVAVLWDFPSELPSIRTDGEKIKQILHHLIHNAIKFTEEGTITVSARMSENDDSQKQPWLEIEVADTGIGIPGAHLPFIFDKFRQVDGSGSRSYEGAGIGLYIVKRFAELLGGKVAVKSEPGKGSTFTVRLPCA